MFNSPRAHRLKRRISINNDTQPAAAHDGDTIESDRPRASSSRRSSIRSSSAYDTADPSQNDPDTQPLISSTPSGQSHNDNDRFTYLKSKQFYLVLALTQILAVCHTGTNSLTTLLANEGTSIPAFQSLFNYILLNVIYTSYTIHQYGFRGWTRLLFRDGWKFLILAVLDVEGNYFTVLAYRYTTILSAQLIDFWAIAVVVLVSFVFLGVRYHVAQYAGILICCGGLGMMIASDHMTGISTGSRALDAVKGDFFCLLGATFYGLDNVLQEFLVSKKPVYEVVGQLAFWATFINGIQALIFDRESFITATWNSAVFTYLAIYTIILTFFYSAAPIILRMASAAFFNIGLLTANFWGLVIGLELFRLQVHWMYPVAFALILAGNFVYYGTEGMYGEAKKPWLGENQEGGEDGVGTASRKLERGDVVV